MIDLYIFGVGIIFILFISYLCKRNKIIVNQVDAIKKRNIKILSYNVKRKFCKKINNDFNNLDFDVICLQELYPNRFSCNKNILYYLKKYNYLMAPTNKLGLGSGLTILSKFPIVFIDFVSFNNCSSSLVFQYGFLVARIRKIIFINVNFYPNNINVQLKILYDYVNNLNGNVVIMGDFKINVFTINCFEKFVNVYHLVPTHWIKKKCCTNIISQDKDIANMIPVWNQGGLIKSIKHSHENINTERIFNTSNNLGISFEIVKKKN